MLLACMLAWMSSVRRRLKLAAVRKNQAVGVIRTVRA